MRKKAAPKRDSRIFIKKLPLLDAFCRFEASCANVTVNFLTVFHVRNFLNVYFKSSSRFTVGVADVVAGRLAFSTNAAYSGHINTSAFCDKITLFCRFCPSSGKTAILI